MKNVNAFKKRKCNLLYLSFTIEGRKMSYISMKLVRFIWTNEKIWEENYEEYSKNCCRFSHVFACV